MSSSPLMKSLNSPQPPVKDHGLKKYKKQTVHKNGIYKTLPKPPAIKSKEHMKSSLYNSTDSISPLESKHISYASVSQQSSNYISDTKVLPSTPKSFNDSVVLSIQSSSNSSYDDGLWNDVQILSIKDDEGNLTMINEPNDYTIETLADLDEAIYMSGINLQPNEKIKDDKDKYLSTGNGYYVSQSNSELRVNENMADLHSKQLSRISMMLLHMDDAITVSKNKNSAIAPSELSDTTNDYSNSIRFEIESNKDSYSRKKEETSIFEDDMDEFPDKYSKEGSFDSDVDSAISGDVTSSNSTPLSRSIPALKSNGTLKVDKDFNKHLKLVDPKKRLSTRLSINFTIPQNIANQSGIIVGNQHTFLESDSFTVDSRFLINHGRIWQVVSETTVKDRYMLLFNDLLVLTKSSASYHNKKTNWSSFKNAKPSETDEAALNGLIESKYTVKDVFPMNLVNIRTKDERWQFEYSPPTQDMIEGISLFNLNPVKAVFLLMSSNQIKRTPITVAHFLHTTPQLSKYRIGQFLSSTEYIDILESFLDLLPMENMLICQAYRMFLSTIQLPKTATAIEHILSYFSKAWHKKNRDNIGYSEKMTLKLILCLTELNADIHLSVHNVGKITSDFFVQRFTRYLLQDKSICTEAKVKCKIDPKTPNYSLRLEDFGLSKVLLYSLFNNINRERLEMVYTPARQVRELTIQVEPSFISSCIYNGNHGYSKYGLKKAEFMKTEEKSIAEKELETKLTPLPFPTRQVLKEESPVIQVQIPNTDPRFYIKLHAKDMIFEPHVLTFSKSNIARFTMKPINKSGKRLVVFEKCGKNSNKYSVPHSRIITVEPQFLKHSFEITVKPEANDNSNYCKQKKVLIVLPNENCRQEWFNKFEELNVSLDSESL